MTFAAPSVEGTRVRIDPFDFDSDGPFLSELDWTRSLNPVMAGWVSRTGTPGTVVVRDASLKPDDPDAAVGVIDVADLPGYPGVANVSIFTDTTRARGGIALEGYGLVVESVFSQGARIVHHEVLEPNGSIRRAMRVMGVQPSARYREHAYVAGRWWDVLIYAYDAEHWSSLLKRLPRNPFSSAPSGPDRPDASGNRVPPQP